MVEASLLLLMDVLHTFHGDQASSTSGSSQHCNEIIFFTYAWCAFQQIAPALARSNFLFGIMRISGRLLEMLTTHHILNILLQPEKLCHREMISGTSVDSRV